METTIHLNMKFESVNNQAGRCGLRERRGNDRLHKRRKRTCNTAHIYIIIDAQLSQLVRVADVRLERSRGLLLPKMTDWRVLGANDGLPVSG